MDVSGDEFTEGCLVRSSDRSQLLADIERLRKRLTDEYCKPASKRDDDMVLKLSRKLDELIVKYYLK